MEDVEMTETVAVAMIEMAATVTAETAAVAMAKTAMADSNDREGGGQGSSGNDGASEASGSIGRAWRRLLVVTSAACRT
jgi:hypothetical protein